MTALRLAFAGTPEFAALHLQALLASPHTVAGVLCQPDRRSGRGKQTRPGPVKSCALEHGIDVLQPATLRAADIQERLRGLQLDALVVVAYGLILPQEVLDLPRFGCLNVHGSLLPRWRGAAPIQRAIEAGDAESGVTIMQMDAGLDTGPMLKKAACAITPMATSGDLYARLAELGPQALCSVLDDLPAHLARAEEQDDSLATYADKIDKREAQLDWSQPAPVLARRIRAFNPAPGCYSLLGGQRIKIWRGQARPGSKASPGTITAASGTGILVACAEGSLEVTELQLPGARSLPAAEVLRGRAELFATGARFDSVPSP